MLTNSIENPNNDVYLISLIAMTKVSGSFETMMKLRNSFFYVVFRTICS